MTPSGLAFLDDNGSPWTAQAITCEKPGCICGLRFSHPSFLEPLEQWETREVPECWPDCKAEELRRRLRLASTSRREPPAPARPVLTELQRTVIQRLREGGFTALAELAYDHWSVGTPIPGVRAITGSGNSRDPMRDLLEHLNRANGQATGH